jgi:hypothetical protein
VAIAVLRQDRSPNQLPVRSQVGKHQPPKANGRYLLTIGATALPSTTTKFTTAVQKTICFVLRSGSVPFAGMMFLP